MAKASSKAVVAAEEPKKAVVPANGNLPAYLQGYQGPTGAEGIDSNDLVIPRVKIGQAMSKEVKAGELDEGDLYLNLTKEVLAENGKSLPIIPLYRFKEFILWRPQEDNGGGILARAKAVVENGVTRYKWDKPNQSFEVKVGGKIKVTWKTKNYIDEDGLDQWGSEIPNDKESGIAATAHHNYVVALPSRGNLIAALSLSKSATKKAKNFNSLLKLGSAPIFARVFDVKTVDEQNNQGQAYKNFDISPAGFVMEEDRFKFYADIAKSFSGKSIAVDHSDGQDEDQDSNGPL